MSTAELAAYGEGAEMDEAMRHWRAVIACLPSAAKREAAWDFYSRRLANAGSAGDLLSGFVLLLEAHGLFLEQLPTRCHEQFILPFEAQQRALRAAVDAFHERQSQALAAIEKVSERNIRASTRALISIGIVRNRLREAATGIDAQALVDGVSKQLEEKALTPLADTLGALSEKTSACEQTATAAQTAIERWRRVHLGGIVLCGWGVAALVFAALFFVGWVRLERAQEQKIEDEREALLATTAKNQEIVRLLGSLRVALRLRPAKDNAGAQVPNALTLSIEAEPKSDVLLHASDEPGVTVLRTSHAPEVLRRMREWLDKARP